MKMIENEMNVNVPLEIVKASDIEPKEVKWLWYPYIPFGKVTLLQGDPGDGKSKFMLSLAALLSKGDTLPFSDEEEREPMGSDTRKTRKRDYFRGRILKLEIQAEDRVIYSQNVFGNYPVEDNSMG